MEKIEIKLELLSSKNYIKITIKKYLKLQKHCTALVVSLATSAAAGAGATVWRVHVDQLTLTDEASGGAFWTLCKMLTVDAGSPARTELQ